MRVVLFAAMALRLPAQPVYFNHTTIFVSKDTYAALKSSALLRDEFSAFREATIHAEGGALSYTGFVLGRVALSPVPSCDREGVPVG